jgi:hypothetical protein
MKGYVIEEGILQASEQKCKAAKLAFARVAV